MKDLLFEFYLTTDGIKLLTFIRDKGRLANKKGIQTHWKDSGLGLMKLQQKSVAPAIVAYNRWQEDEKKKNGIKNKANGASEKAIPVELELFMRCLIKQLALCGQGIGKIAAKQIFVEALKDGSNDGRFSRSTLNRFIQNYELECKNVKNIDPARISQVTEENRDALFFRLDQVVMLLHTIDSTNCPWKNWAEVGAEFKYNMDEMGTDPTKFRDLLLIPQEIIHRIFQSTPEGDRPSVHCSVAQFSRSDGKYKDAKAKIEGAPMQMVIHSIQSKKKSNSSAAERRIGLYEQQETPPVHDKYTDGFQRHKNLGIIVCTSINGSMTKELFLVAVEHLVENIASDQGANGLYSFLLLDSHVSRWNPRALYLLFKNRIIPVFFPSHLSIVVQPQDNGVILFLHKCLEEASLMDRLFATETDISYSNRVMAKAFHLFREGERKKLMTRGSNSTTKSWKVTGMEPSNPYSDGWRENLEMYASFNGLRIKEDGGCRYYGVRPKDNNVCPSFTESDTSLLNDAVPNLVSDGSKTVLDHGKAKCYAVAEGIINEYIEKPSSERAWRPRAVTDVEKVALQHMEIVQIVSAEPKSEDSLLLDKNYENKKQNAMLTLAKPTEGFQVKPKESNNQNKWHTAQMMDKHEMWNIFDGTSSVQLTTDQLQAQYIINISYHMFPKDNRLIENGHRSDRRRRNEKEMIIKRMAKVLAEEERRADLKEVYNTFNLLPAEERSFINFESRMIAKIEKPSNHIVTVKLGSETHTIKVAAHGHNTSSMNQLVMDNICRTIIGNSNQKEKKKTRRGGRVNRVKRGSDGFVKSLQMDQQHLNDISTEEAAAEKKRKKAIVSCKRRLKCIQTFSSIDEYEDIWNDNSTIQLQKLKKKALTNLLKIFDVAGRARLLNNPPIRAALSGLAITQASINFVKTSNLKQLEEYGEEYNPDDCALDLSIADGSIANTSIIDNSIVDHSIDNIVLSVNDPDTSLFLDDDEISDDGTNFMILESEISGGDAGSETDNVTKQGGIAGSGSETDDTAKLDKLIEGVRNKKSVSFNKTPLIRMFSQQAATSSDATSSDNEELYSRRPRRACTSSRRRTNHSRCKTTTRASKRGPTKTTPSPSPTPTLPPDASRSEASPPLPPPPPPPQVRRSSRLR